MVVPSSLEVLCDAYIKVRVGILGGGFVDNVSPVALPVERAVFLHRGLAAAFFRAGLLFLLFLQSKRHRPTYPHTSTYIDILLNQN